MKYPSAPRRGAIDRFGLLAIVTCREKHGIRAKSDCAMNMLNGLKPLSQVAGQSLAANGLPRFLLAKLDVGAIIGDVLGPRHRRGRACVAGLQPIGWEARGANNN